MSAPVPVPVTPPTYTPVPGQKMCYGCKQLLPTTTEFFYRDASRKDGLSGMCRECSKKYANGYYKKKHAEAKEERRLSRKKATRKKAWVARQEKLTAMGTELTEEEWQETLQEFDYACAYCGATSNLQKDHVVPVESGGGTTKWNVVPACSHCNASKAEADLTNWYLQQPFYSPNRFTNVCDFVRKYKPEGVEQAEQAE